jgi:hypothetical protein
MLPNASFCLHVDASTELKLRIELFKCCACIIIILVYMAQVGALQDVRSELTKLRGVLFYKVLEDLHAHLYNKGEYRYLLFFLTLTFISFHTLGILFISTSIVLIFFLGCWVVFGMWACDGVTRHES